MTLDLELHPFATVPVEWGRSRNERAQHPFQAGVRCSTVDERPHLDGQAFLAHLDLDRQLPSRGGVAVREHAVDRQLEVVDLRVRQIEPRAEAAQHEVDDAQETTLGRNREGDRVHGHGR